MGRLGIKLLCAWAAVTIHVTAYAQPEPTPPTEEAPAEGEPAPADGEATGDTPPADEAAADAEAAPVREEAPPPAEVEAPAEPPPAAVDSPEETALNVETPAPTFYVLSMPADRMREDPAPVMAIQAAIFSHIQSRVEGRPVELLRVRERLEAIMGCADDGVCIANQLAELGAAGAVIIRTDRGPRRGVSVVIEHHSPVSPNAGAGSRVIQNTLIQRGDLEDPAESLSETFASMETHLPEPPRVSTLLFAVNVEGASVTVDGEQAGMSPLGPMEVRRGRRQVTVRRDGFDVYRRTVTVGLSEDIRVNVDLVPEEGTDMVFNEAGDLVVAADTGPAPWYKRWYVWAGAGGAVVLTTIIIAVAAGGDSTPPDPSGFRIPPLE